MEVLVINYHKILVSGQGMVVISQYGGYTGGGNPSPGTSSGGGGGAL